MANQTTGLDATNTFLSALQGMGSGAIAGGQASMSAATNLGAVQQQAALRDQMDQYKDQVADMQQNIGDETELRKQMLQFSQRAQLQIAGMGGNKEQMAAVANLTPQIPNSAQQAFVQGQMLGDPSMMHAGKSYMDEQTGNEIAIKQAELRNQLIMENTKYTDQTFKGLKQTAYKNIGTNEAQLPIQQEIGNKISQAFAGLGISYNPATKSLRNMKTGETIDGSNMTSQDIAKLADKWGSTSHEGLTTGLGSLLNKFTPFGKDAAGEASLLNGIAQDLVESKSKLIGVRAIAGDKSREFFLSNKPGISDDWRTKTKKLLDYADDVHANLNSMQYQNAKWKKAVGTDSRSFADYVDDPLNDSNASYTAPVNRNPIGATQNSMPNLPKGLGLIPMSK